MAIIYNKVTGVWDSVEDTSGLSADWIINPVFENEEFANEIGPKYWTYVDNLIKTPTKEEYDALLLIEHRITKWKEIQEYRDSRLQTGGYKVAATDDWYHSDNISRIQQIGLVMLGANMPPGIKWKTMSGSFVDMTPTLAQQIFQTAAASDTAQHYVAEVHRQQVMASADPMNYDFKHTAPTWPLIYGE